MRLSDFRIASKLVAAFVAVALLGAALGGYAIYNMKQIDDADTRVLRQARLNMADRSSRWRLPRPG